MVVNVQAHWVPQLIKLCKHFLMMDLILLYSPEGTTVRRLYIIRLQTVAMQELKTLNNDKHLPAFSKLIKALIKYEVKSNRKSLFIIYSFLL